MTATPRTLADAVVSLVRGHGTSERGINAVLASLADHGPWRQASDEAAQLAVRHARRRLNFSVHVEARLAFLLHPGNQTLSVLVSRLIAERRVPLDDDSPSPAAAAASCLSCFSAVAATGVPAAVHALIADWFDRYIVVSASLQVYDAFNNTAINTATQAGRSHFICRVGNRVVTALRQAKEGGEPMLSVYQGPALALMRTIPARIPADHTIVRYNDVAALGDDRVAVACSYLPIQVWNIKTGEPVMVFQDKPSLAFVLAVMSSDNVAVVSAASPKVRVWHSGSGQVLGELASSSRPQCASIVPGTASQLVIGQANGSVVRWDWRAAARAHVRSAEAPAVACVETGTSFCYAIEAVTPDAAVTGSEHGTAVLDLARRGGDMQAHVFPRMHCWGRPLRLSRTSTLCIVPGGGVWDVLDLAVFPPVYVASINNPHVHLVRRPSAAYSD